MAIDAAAYRQIFGHFATGVTVITTARNGMLHGMTANAVASVSLNPLLLLVCVDKAAHAHKEIESAGAFAVNILSSEQEHVSRLFAEKREPEEGSLGGIPYHLGASGSPIIDGALAHVECVVADSFKGGDHTVFIGRVMEGSVDSAALPLIFFRGGYRQLG
jgi:flavin reductase (DIM6/NTAB) family NADH-FMN oxidoreductase RutF